MSDRSIDRLIDWLISWLIDCPHFVSFSQTANEPESTVSTPVTQTTTRKRTRSKLFGTAKRKKKSSTTTQRPAIANATDTLLDASEDATNGDAPVADFLDSDGPLNGIKLKRSSTSGNRVVKSAQDYCRQIGLEELRATDDGLDVFCIKCEKVLTKVSQGYRIRIDNLRTHINSFSHKTGVISYCFLCFLCIALVDKPWIGHIFFSHFSGPAGCGDLSREEGRASSRGRR